jgi:hypothetical protein
MSLGGADRPGRFRQMAPLPEATGFAFLTAGRGVRHGDEIELIPPSGTTMMCGHYGRHFIKSSSDRK